MVRLHKVSTQPNDLDRLLRMVRAYPGNLDLYLEVNRAREGPPGDL